MPVYRYKRIGLDIEEVKKQVPPADAGSVSAGDIGPTQVWDITAPTTSKDDLDYYMSSRGWTFDSTDPTSTPAEQSAGDQDHGELLGLGDDDHTQYHDNTRGDARYYQKTEWTNKAQLDLVTDGDHDVRSDNPHSVSAAQAGAAPSTHASQHQHGGADEVATATPAANAIPKADGSGKLNAWVDATGSGDVVGPASATDEALARFNTTTGKLIQNSLVRVNDSGYMGIDTAPSTTNPLRVTGVELPDFGINVGSTTSYNNYDVGDSSNFNFHSANQDFEITGLASAVQGKLVIIHNTTDYELTLRHEDTGSLANNRFDLPRDTDLTLPPNGAMTFTYGVQGGGSKWRVVVYPGSSPRLYDAIVSASGGDYTSIKAAFDSGALTVYVRTGVYVETAAITLPTAGSALHGEGGSVVVFTGTARFQLDGSGGVQETAGTISVATDSTTVTGSGTTFTNQTAGDWIKLGDSWLQIDSITNDTSLELEAAWRGDALSGESFIIQDMAGGVSLSLLNVAGASNGCLYIRASIGISIRDCVFQHATAGPGATIVDSYGVHIEQSFLKGNVGGGIIITSCNEVTLEGSCHFDNNDADGILVNGASTHIAITNSSCTNNDGDGVSVEGTTREVVTSNMVCDLNNGKGFNTEPTTEETTIISSVFEHNGGWGVDFDGASNAVFGCIINENTSGGVQFGDSGIIAACQVNENSGVGLNILGGDDNNVVMGNRIVDNSGDGISLTADFNTFTGNYIADNGGYGVDIGVGGDDNRFSGNIIRNNTLGNWRDLGLRNRVTDYDEYSFEADMLEYPNNSDWAVNALATLDADGSNNGIAVKEFDDTTQEGVGFTVRVPFGASVIKLGFASRALTAPGTAQTVALTLYERGIPDNGAVEAWSSAYQLTNVNIPTNANFQYDEQTIAFSTLGLTAGRVHQFELTRDTADAGDTLTGDWVLQRLKVSFA